MNVKKFSTIFNFLLLVLLFFLQTITCDFANGHYYWRLGQQTDYTPPIGSLTGGVVLAGGSTDVDSAMKWFLQKAAGGDVIVFRNARSGSTAADYPTADAYNPYFYSELDVRVNSVETILLNGPTTANNQFVADKVRKAEAVFFTGGDQWYFFESINKTMLQIALDELVNIRRGVIGGTSAGCAIMGEFGFTAEAGTIDTATALKNPYTKTLTIARGLIANKWLENVITDTHYGNRDRQGRHVTFMARIAKDDLESTGGIVRGIGVDEKTAVCLDTISGVAYVFGSQNAYFYEQTFSNGYPEICERNKNLNWVRSQKALKVYRVLGDQLGVKWFDLSNWTRGLGGQWLHAHVDNGKFFLI